MEEKEKKKEGGGGGGGPHRGEGTSRPHATRPGRRVRAHNGGGAVLGHAGVVEVVGVAGLDDAHAQGPHTTHTTFRSRRLNSSDVWFTAGIIKKNKKPRDKPYVGSGEYGKRRPHPHPSSSCTRYHQRLPSDRAVGAHPR